LFLSLHGGREKTKLPSAGASLGKGSVRTKGGGGVVFRPPRSAPFRGRPSPSARVVRNRERWGSARGRPSRQRKRVFGGGTFSFAQREPVQSLVSFSFFLFFFFFPLPDRIGGVLEGETRSVLRFVAGRSLLLPLARSFSSSPFPFLLSLPLPLFDSSAVGLSYGPAVCSM
jgi:hypothetical protein